MNTPKKAAKKAVKKTAKKTAKTTKPRAVRKKSPAIKTEYTSEKEFEQFNKYDKQISESNKSEQEEKNSFKENGQKYKGNKSIAIASILLYLVAAVTILMGLYYLFSSDIASYHWKFLSEAPDDIVGDKELFLMLALMGVAGGCFLAIACTQTYLVAVPFQQGEPWAWWSILILQGISLPLTLIQTLRIGSFSPWWVVATLIVFLVVALFISREACGVRSIKSMFPPNRET